MKQFTLALGFAALGAVALSAQDVKSTTEVKVDEGKPVMYTGCLQTGTTANSFVLENAIPVKTETKTETEVRGDEAKTTTTTTYSLVPAGTLNFQQNVGHKVEVTAMLIPAGDDKSKIETKTKTEVDGKDASEQKVEEKVAQSATPQLRVVSVKHLADRCVG